MVSAFISLYTISAIFLWLIAFVLYKNPKAMINRVCALLFICFFIWNFFSAFYVIAGTEKMAMIWKNIASIGWCSSPAFALWFALAFTRKNTILKKWYFYLLVLIIPAFFIYKQWTGFLVVGNTREFYGWNSVWLNSIWSYLYYIYNPSFMLVSIFLVYYFIHKTKNIYEKKQGTLIIITSIIPFVLGSTTDMILPNLNVNVLPKIGGMLSIIWAGGIVYAITKYNLMALTPAYAASDILGTMSDGLILIDTQGKIIEINNAILNLLGYTRQELINSRAETLFLGQITPIVTGRWDLLIKEDSFLDKQINFRTKRGEYIPVSFSGSAMKDREGNYIGIVCVARDMREIIQLQERERELAAEKARSEALMEKSQELQEALDKLKDAQNQLIQSEKLAAIGQLAGGVAHEINNPMGVILGFAQSIVRRINDDDPLYLPLKSIEREAVRCKKLVVDLLTFSRADKTKTEKIDINLAIDETLSLIEAGAKVKNTEIIKEYQENLPAILANKNQVQQVIVNLCNNAMDAMPKGGKITISTKLLKDWIEIYVCDTGMGMNEEIMMHIFEPFFTTKEVGKGTGLGLSLCYEIIKKHDGTIEAESELNKGTTFKVKLPLN